MSSAFSEEELFVCSAEDVFSAFTEEELFPVDTFVESPSLIMSKSSAASFTVLPESFWSVSFGAVEGPASCVLEAQHRPILSDSGPAAPWSPGVQALLLDATHLPMLPTHLDTSHNQTYTSTASVSKGGDSTVPDWWKTLDITGLTP